MLRRCGVCGKSGGYYGYLGAMNAVGENRIADRMRPTVKLPGRQTARAALVLRHILGPVRLRPVRQQVGRPQHQAETALEILDLPDVGSGGRNL